MSIQEGSYMIVKNNDYNGYRLTLEKGEENSFVYAIGPGGAGGQEWKLKKCHNGNYVIESTKFDGHFCLSPEQLHPNAYLVVKGEPFEWRIQPGPSGEENKYHIIVPGGLIDGTELAADLSLVKIFPPRTTLRPLQAENYEQAWFMIKKDDEDQ